METEHIQEINHINAQIVQMKQDHEVFVQKQEANYNEKLIMEYNKYRRLEEKMEMILKEKEEKYNEMVKTHQKEIETLRKEHEEEIKEKNEQHEDVCQIFFTISSNY